MIYFISKNYKPAADGFVGGNDNIDVNKMAHFRVSEQPYSLEQEEKGQDRAKDQDRDQEPHQDRVASLLWCLRNLTAGALTCGPSQSSLLAAWKGAEEYDSDGFSNSKNLGAPYEWYWVWEQNCKKIRFVWYP